MAGWMVLVLMMMLLGRGGPSTGCRESKSSVVASGTMFSLSMFAFVMFCICNIYT